MKTDVKKLSIEDRVKLTMGANCWNNYDLGGKLYRFTLSDATIGLRTSKDLDNWASGVISAVAFPSAQMMSHTWNPTLIKRMGNAVANEAIERNVDVVLGPGLNIKRTPLNGRNFEYFSEDPFLTGVLGREYIRGVQEKHVGTCMKHYCCNNQEFSRHWASADVDERTLREIYLEAFRIASEAKPWSVMCAYNLLNGRRMSENKKMYDVLRNEFGFDGIVISDWDAVKDPKATVEQGLALTMPYDERLQSRLLKSAEDGDIDEDALDDCAEQVVRFAEKCQEESRLRKIDMTLEERRLVAADVAREGIVVLKNDSVLPLRTSEKCLVTGAPSFRYYCGGGSSEVIPEIEFIPLTDALREEGFDAEWAESTWESTGHQTIVGNAAEALKRAAECDVTVLTVGDYRNCETESYDRETISLSREEVTLIHDFARVSEKLVVAVYAGSAIDMSEWIDDVDAVVWAGYGGQYGNKALAEVLSGKVNPSGKLTETFPLSIDDLPVSGSYSDSAVVCYDEKLNVGYRYFSTFGEPVLFPFGYGLSYSEFEYDNLTVERRGDGFDVSFDVLNVSDVDGYEVPQVYVEEIVTKVYRPSRELKGFDKVWVKAGEKARVDIRLDRHAFEYYSVADDCWTLHDTTFKILVGAHSKDIRLFEKVRF